MLLIDFGFGISFDGAASLLQQSLCGKRRTAVRQPPCFITACGRCTGINFSHTCLSRSPRCQIPHLAEGVRIHGEKVTEALRPFHERLEACFKQLREKVEKQYGVKTLVRSFCRWRLLVLTFDLSTCFLSPSIARCCLAPWRSTAWLLLPSLEPD